MLASPVALAEVEGQCFPWDETANASRLRSRAGFWGWNGWNGEFGGKIRLWVSELLPRAPCPRKELPAHGHLLIPILQHFCSSARWSCQANQVPGQPPVLVRRGALLVAEAAGKGSILPLRLGPVGWVAGWFALARCRQPVAGPARGKGPSTQLPAQPGSGTTWRELRLVGAHTSAAELHS